MARCTSGVAPEAPRSSQAPLQAPLQSVLLVSERNTAHSVGIVRFLERAGAQLPPPLLSFAQGVLAAREEQKMERPLCSYLKTSGVCRSEHTAPEARWRPGVLRASL